MSTTSPPQEGKRKTFDLYRAVWRWHFYAGLLVLPFMITLAITGGLYLFKDELDALIHADVKRVAVRGATLPSLYAGKRSPYGSPWHCRKIHQPPRRKARRRSQ